MSLESVFARLCVPCVAVGGIEPNPTYAKVQEGAKIARENNVDFILAVGGGSVIDCCKIVSIQAKIDEDIWSMQYGKERRMATDCIPMGSIVTASGTGAEQNNGAVITNEELKLKQPLFGAFNSFAVLDSDLTLTLPMKQVISGAFDTLSHCMETYMGRPAHTNLTDEINEAIMRNVIKNIRALIADPDNDFARGELMWASAMAENSILKLGKITDFQCHMLEHAVGAYTDCNHGAGLAIIHPTLYRHMQDEGAEKLAAMAENVWGITEGTVWEEAEHASKFAELLGDCEWDTKTNLYKCMMAEAGTNVDKMRIAKAKKANLDAIHETVHEMAKDEIRHGRGFAGLYARYFGDNK